MLTRAVMAAAAQQPMRPIAASMQRCAHRCRTLRCAPSASPLHRFAAAHAPAACRFSVLCSEEPTRNLASEGPNVQTANVQTAAAAAAVTSTPPSPSRGGPLCLLPTTTP